MTAPAQEALARFRPDEIVVAKPHCELVLGELQDSGNKLRSVTKRTSDDLARYESLLGLSIIDVEYEDTTLDDLMAAVRTSCDRKYDHWVPTMGKNRLLDRVDGGGVGAARAHIGGGGHPKLADKDDISQFKSVLEDNKGQGQDRRWWRTGRRIKVALLDTKIYKHPDFGKGLKIDEKALLSNDGRRVLYPAGHATFVAGLISQQAGSIDLNPVSVLNDEGEADAWDLACRMVDLAGSDTKVLNLSLGCFTDDNMPPLLLRRAVELLAPNTVIVAAAGNHGGGKSEYNVKPNAPFWPAALDYVIGVGAATKRDSKERAAFSPDAPWVRLLGPGDQVTSTFPENVEVPGDKGTHVPDFGRYAKWSGTSFAAAAITGRIAALMAARKLPSPLELVGLSGEELEALLEP